MKTDQLLKPSTSKATSGEIDIEEMSGKQEAVSLEEKKEANTTLLNELINSLLAAQSSTLKIAKQDSVSSFYQPEVLEPCTGGFLGWVGCSSIVKDEDNFFLTEDEKKSMSHITCGIASGSPIEVGPPYKALTRIMKRVEEVTVNKMNSLYKENIKKLLELAQRVEKSLDGQKSALNEQSSLARDLVIKEEEQISSNDFDKLVEYRPI